MTFPIKVYRDRGHCRRRAVAIAVAEAKRVAIAVAAGIAVAGAVRIADTVAAGVAVAAGAAVGAAVTGAAAVVALIVGLTDTVPGAGCRRSSTPSVAPLPVADGDSPFRGQGRR